MTGGKLFQHQLVLIQRVGVPRACPAKDDPEEQGVLALQTAERPISSSLPTCVARLRTRGRAASPGRRVSTPESPSRPSLFHGPTGPLGKPMDPFSDNVFKDIK